MSKSIQDMIYKSIICEIYYETMMLSVESLQSLSDTIEWVVE